jgi:xanthine dehydrogenase accessory factor
MESNPTGNIYRNLLNLLDAGEKAVMVTRIGRGSGGKNPLPDITLLREEDLRTCRLEGNPEGLYENARYALETGGLQYVNSPDKGVLLVEPYFPEPNLIVFGGGHIAKPLAEFASRVGFHVTVIDDRPSFANTSRFPDAERVICESFENSFSLLNLNPSSYAVIVTRGHRHDTYCLRQVLKYDTAYTGMIGSKRRVKIVKEQLLDEGYPRELLDRVNAPIGLDIGAVTPEEIAVAIAAQVISYRRKTAVSGMNPTGKAAPLEFDRSVLEELAEGVNGARAVVTVIASKGSVPRKAGAKMIVYPDGRILGSIGGGCSEGQAITAARDVIRNGGYEIREIDLTDDAAEEEGMVCGGIMEVVIEKA